MTPATNDPGNDLIREEAPGLWRTLSALGRRVRQPEDFLPQQSAEARGKTFNATIGQITDGHGHAVALPALAAALAALPAAERSRALLYSPLEGLPELRLRWRELQRQGWTAGTPSSLPLVTAGAGLAREVLAELFVDAGRTVLLAVASPGSPSPVSSPAGLGGARELFELRRGARVIELPAGARSGGSGNGSDGGSGRRGRGSDGGSGRSDRGSVAAASWPDPAALERALGGLPAGEPVMLLLAGGATGADARDLREALVAAAALRPIVALVEDGSDDGEAAAQSQEGDGGEVGLGGAAGSLFADLIGRHADLAPFLVEGTAKLGFPGAALGFLTLPFAAESRLAQELEKKLKMLLRAAVGSPSALTQVLLLDALGAAADGVERDARG